MLMMKFLFTQKMLTFDESRVSSVNRGSKLFKVLNC